MAVEDSSFIGKQIGSYTIIAEVDSGSYGSVYRAKHIIFSDKPIVAIKLLHAHLKSPREREQFIQEAQLLNMLRHPYILPIIDAAIQEGLPYIIMELASRGSLQDRLDQLRGRPMAIDEALTILKQIGQALQHAHQQNIVHRDLKPGNILFNAKGDALLADFGIAAVLATAHTKDMGRGGTPAYMAPEQFEGKVSVKSDQYALGCIAYELVTGKKPFDVENVGLEAVWFQHAKVLPVFPANLNPRVPAPIEQAILRAMAKDRINRHSDISMFIMACTVLPSFDSGLLNKTPKELFDEGIMLLNSNRYAEALAIYERVTHMTPGDGSAFYNKGVALDGLKRYEEAIVAYNMAIQLNSQHVSSHYNKGVALGSLKRYTEALAAYDQTLRLDPNKVNAYYNKGVIYDELKRYTEAITCYDQALRLNPGYVSAYYNKGVALGGLKRYVEAIACYDQALRLDPGKANAYYNKGVALGSLKRYEEAIVVYDQALRLDPSRASAYNNKASALYLLKRYQESLAVYEQALVIDPRSATGQDGKGWALNKLGRYAEALVAFEQATRLDPNYANAYDGRGNALYYLARFTESLTAYDQATRLDPKYANAYNGKGWALYGLNRYADAIAAWDYALYLDPRDANAYTGKGNAYKRMGMETEAKQAEEKARQLNASR
ncbi:MAG: tetratricopeptide repeat protein [Ktedonobacteraceae bacterium]